jgi:hypothetical protein
MMSVAYIRTDRRTYSVWPIALSFVLGLAFGMLLGMGAGWRDHEAVDLARRISTMNGCLDGVAVTVHSERGDKTACWYGSGRKMKNGD